MCRAAVRAACIGVNEGVPTHRAPSTRARTPRRTRTRTATRRPPRTRRTRRGRVGRPRPWCRARRAPPGRARPRLLRRLEAGQPVESRGHVGVLERGGRAVAAREELEGLDLPLIDPAGAGRRRDKDDSAIKGTRAAQLGDHRRRCLLDARPTRGHAGVDADGFHGLAAADLRDVEARGPRPRKTRPWPPTDSQVTGEAGDAERSGTNGL